MTLVSDPIAIWTPISFAGVDLFLHWMALAWSSVFLRFLYVALQEYVHGMVHQSKNHNH